MTDAAMLLVEVLYQLRSSIDALAEGQSQVRENAIGSDIALSLVHGLADVRRSVEKLTAQQAEFQRDVVSLLENISQSMPQASATGTLELIERDVSLIADRYRPFESDLSPNLND